MKKINEINQILLFILIVFVLLYFGSPFLVPFVFGVFFASLMAPFSNFLEKHKINRVFSSLISTMVIFIVTGIVLYITMLQINRFVLEIPDIRYEIQNEFENIQKRIASATDLSVHEQRELWRNRSPNIIGIIEAGLTRFLGDVVNIAGGFLLVLVYLFLLLYYRSKFKDSFLMFMSNEKKKKAEDILEEISEIVYHYLWGRVKVMAILAILYYITFLIFDLPYAGLLTIFGALITIIPYLGPFLSGILPIIFAIFYLPGFSLIILFTVIIIIIQLTESYVFEPVIIGHEVKINPLIVIIAIMMGAMIWGLAGMILFVPVFAVLKIIADHSPSLKPVGYFLGSSSKSRS